MISTLSLIINNVRRGGQQGWSDYLSFSIDDLTEWEEPDIPGIKEGVNAREDTEESLERYRARITMEQYREAQARHKAAGLPGDAPLRPARKKAPAKSRPASKERNKEEATRKANAKWQQDMRKRALDEATEKDQATALIEESDREDTSWLRQVYEREGLTGLKIAIKYGYTEE